MTTKTKKTPVDILIEPMVGSFVLRAVFEPHYRFLDTRNNFTKDLHLAAEFTTATEAAEVAREFNRDVPEEARTLTICKVADAAGTLTVLESVYVGGAEAEGPTDDGDAPVPAQGELLPADAGAAVVTPTNGLQLNSPGAARMTAIGLKTYAADLKKEAKNLRELGKEKEAQSCDADATVITQTLLPQLEPQVKIPFGYADVKAALSARISGALRAKLSEQIRRDTPIIAGETDKDRQDKITQKIDDFEELVGSTASIVTALVEPCIARAAEQGMVAGRLARETTADTLALEAVESVMAS